MRVIDIALLSIMVMLCMIVLSITLLISPRLGDIEDAISTADIAGTRVPPVSCQEDEAIWWTGPDTLGCVHFEEVR